MIEISWKLIKFSDTNSLQKSGLVSDNQQLTTAVAIAVAAVVATAAGSAPVALGCCCCCSTLCESVCSVCVLQYSLLECVKCVRSEYVVCA